MSRSIARVPVFVTAFLLSTAFALATLLFTVPAAHAVETTTFSQKLSSALCVRSPELTEQISAALADGIVSAKQEAFVDESRAGEFYFAQNGSGRCTITSVAMMVRRAAFLDDRADWQSIDLASVTADGWSSSGVKWHFATGAATKSASSTSRALWNRFASCSHSILKASPHTIRAFPTPSCSLTTTRKPAPSIAPTPPTTMPVRVSRSPSHGTARATAKARMPSLPDSRALG